MHSEQKKKRSNMRIKFYMMHGHKSNNVNMQKKGKHDANMINNKQKSFKQDISMDFGDGPYRISGMELCPDT